MTRRGVVSAAIEAITVEGTHTETVKSQLGRLVFVLSTDSPSHVKEKRQSLWDPWTRRAQTGLPTSTCSAPERR